MSFKEVKIQMKKKFFWPLVAVCHIHYRIQYEIVQNVFGNKFGYYSSLWNTIEFVKKVKMWFGEFFENTFFFVEFCRCASIQQLQFGTQPINFEVMEDFELLLVFRPRQIFWWFVPFKIFSPQILHFWSSDSERVFWAHQMFWSFCRISIFLGIYIF